MSQLLLIALSTWASEDLGCIAAGLLIAQGRLGWFAGTRACFAGIFSGDVLLYVAGRYLGRPLLQRFIAADRLDRASAWLSKSGIGVVFASRFTPGLRTATYAAAGALRAPWTAFMGYMAVAALVWTPLLVGSVALFGKEILRGRWILGLALLAILAIARLRRFPLRKLQWEFWPMWLAYAPVVPYILYLAARFRSLTLFMWANPGIPTGGFVGESKSDILRKLDRVAPFRIADAAVIPEMFPVVLKPDIGERGKGVAVIRSSDEYRAYMQGAKGLVIEQQYIAGEEFGVFYCRSPDQPRGRIISITEKHFPAVIGDGELTIEELIEADSRAACMAGAYARSCRRPIADIPAAGERVQLAELGSHCRGAVFLDGRRWNSAALEAEIDRVSKFHPGFYLGRYDVRAASGQALRRGEFTVLELNGVSSEPTHIYDPAVGIVEAYRTLYRHWRTAFEIGAANRARKSASISCRCMNRTTAEDTNTTIASANSSPWSSTAGKEIPSLVRWKKIAPLITPRESSAP